MRLLNSSVLLPTLLSLCFASENEYEKRDYSEYHFSMVKCEFQWRSSRARELSQKLRQRSHHSTYSQNSFQDPTPTESFIE